MKGIPLSSNLRLLTVTVLGFMFSANMKSKTLNMKSGPLKRETGTAGRVRLDVGGRRLSPPTFDLQLLHARRAVSGGTTRNADRA